MTPDHTTVTAALPRVPPLPGRALFPLQATVQRSDV